jgi:hypothetical protein
MDFVGRIFTREQDRDETPALAVRDAQAEAITDWGIPDTSKLARRAGITQPTLVANGNNDIMVPTVNRELVPPGRPHPQRPARHLPGRRPRRHPASCRRCCRSAASHDTGRAIMNVRQRLSRMPKTARFGVAAAAVGLCAGAFLPLGAAASQTTAAQAGHGGSAGVE